MTDFENTIDILVTVINFISYSDTRIILTKKHYSWDSVLIDTGGKIECDLHTDRINWFKKIGMIWKAANCYLWDIPDSGFWNQAGFIRRFLALIYLVLWCRKRFPEYSDEIAYTLTLFSLSNLALMLNLFVKRCYLFDQLSLFLLRLRFVLNSSLQTFCTCGQTSFFNRRH